MSKDPVWLMAGSRDPRAMSPEFGPIVEEATGTFRDAL